MCGVRSTSRAGGQNAYRDQVCFFGQLDIGVVLDEDEQFPTVFNGGLSRRQGAPPPDGNGCGYTGKNDAAAQGDDGYGYMGVMPHELSFIDSNLKYL